MNRKIKRIVGVIVVVIALLVKGYEYLNSPSSREVSAPGDLARTSDEKEGRYFILRDCRYVPDKKYNDGDSFKVEASDGRVVEIRMYYVDTAESKDKPYDDYRRRVADQGKDFGGLDYKKTIALGQKAKDFAYKSLKSGKLTVYTSWEEVYDSGRYYAFVQTSDGNWWHETLVKKGLARIHTKGEELPDGTRYAKHKKELYLMEKAARRDKVGAWGM